MCLSVRLCLSSPRGCAAILPRGEAQPIFPAYGYATTTVLISVLAAMSSWVRSLLGLNDPQHSSRRTEAGDSKDRCSHSDNNCPQLNDWDNDPGNTDKGDDEQPVDDQLDSTAIEDFSDDCNHQSEVPSNDMSTDDNPLNIGWRFTSPNLFLLKCREYAKRNGFTVASNFHQFQPANPHPNQGSGKLWQRGKIYCNHKGAGNPNNSGHKNIKSTCTWFVKFTFDRACVTYVVTNTCLEHNHLIDEINVTGDGGVVNISLDVDLREEERSAISEFAKYHLPLFKVLTFCYLY